MNGQHESKNTYNNIRPCCHLSGNMVEMVVNELGEEF